MIKKISIANLSIGMYVEKLDVNWANHPFWKSSFMVETANDLAKIQSSPVSFAWIDDKKGIDILTPTAVKVKDNSVLTKNKVIKKKKNTGVKRSLSEEIITARAVLNSAKEATETMFKDIRMGKSVCTKNVAPLVDEIYASVSRNSSALLCLSQIKNKDDYTYLHSVAVCALMISLGKQMNYSGSYHELGMAGLLHDVGKMLIPQCVLNKEGKLSNEEFDTVKSHPRRGYELLKKTDENICEVALDVCLHHHEKIDGTGYPEGLDSKEMSLEAKMGSICDVYDAITSDRCYKKGWDPAESLKKMASWTKGHLDNELFRAFVKSVGIYPVGTLLRLKSSRLAIVLEQSNRSLLTPQVKIFYSCSNKTPIPIKIVDLATSGEVIDRVERPKDWGFSREFIIDRITQ